MSIATHREASGALSLASLALALALAACGGAAGGGGGGGGGGGSSSSGSSSGGGSSSSGSGSGSGSSSGGTSGAVKRGVAYGFRSVNDLDALEPAMTWWYNWSPRPDAQVAAHVGAEFVPMVWGGQFDDAAVKAGIPAGARYLLGFNEPNFKKGQANLSAAQAAALWPRLEAIADARGLDLVSPAVNYCGPAADCWDTDPVAYLDHFFAACTGCRVDAIAIHSYMCTGDALSWYLSRFKKYGKPIWLTEFSCGDAEDVSLAVQERYMREAVAILEADPQVARYAWFIGRQSPANPGWPVDLLAGDGRLTALGEEYLGLASRP